MPDLPDLSEKTREKLNLARRVLLTLRNKLLTGLALAIPMVATVWVALLAFNFIKGITAPFINALIKSAFGLSPEELSWFNTDFIAFLTTIVLFIGLGFMASHVIGKTILDRLEGIVLRVPLVATIYGGVKQVLESFKDIKSTTKFKRPAYVEYPSPGCRLLGFVTGRFYDTLLKQEFVIVFLPTAPNPMTGFIVMMPPERVHDTPLTLEQATKLIVSAGLVSPMPSDLNPPASDSLLHAEPNGESPTPADPKATSHQ